MTFGSDLRGCREARGMDLLACGKRLSISKSYLSKIENGHRPAPETAKHLAKAADELFGTGRQFQDQVLDGGGPRLSASAELAIDAASVAPWWEPADTAEIVSQFTRRDLILQRREVMRLVAGVLVGNALLEPLEKFLSQAVETPGIGRRGSVGYQDIQHIENTAKIFRDWDDRFGGGLQRKAVVGQLNEVADLLQDSHPPEIRARLFGVMAQLSETAATMSWDSGYQAVAQGYYSLALRAAKTAGDHAFSANVMAGMARQLLYLGHHNDALELVRLAQRDAERVTPAVRSMLYTREAWAYAKLGRISGFQRATAAAENALAEVNPAAEPYWIAYYDAAELEGTTGGRLLELAHQDNRQAEPAAERISRAIESRRTGRLRSSALDEIGLAELRLIQGELEECARLGHQAATLVEQTPSDRVQVKLAELYQYSNPHANVPVITSLRERIQPLCGAQAV